MSKLTKLEMSYLELAYKEALKIKKSKDEKSDSISDVIFGEVSIKSDPEEKGVLDDFIDHAAQCDKSHEVLIDRITVLYEHFNQ